MSAPQSLPAEDWPAMIELALKHADVATKIVQFFVLASVAVGGWVVSSEELRALPPLANQRIVWAILYSLMAAPLWLALMDLQRRINAIYAHIDPTLPEHLRGATRPFDPRLVTFGFPLFVIAVDLIILFMSTHGTE